MAGGRPCNTIEIYKDLGDEIDIQRINAKDKDSLRIWQEQGYTTTPPDGLDLGEEEGFEEEDEEEFDEDED